MISYIYIDPIKKTKNLLIDIIHNIFHIMGFNFYNYYRYPSKLSLFSEIFPNLYTTSSSIPKTSEIYLKYHRYLYGDDYGVVKFFKYDNINYPHLSMINFEDIMHWIKYERNIISQFSLSILEDSTFYMTNLKLCGCNYNGECQFDKFPFEYFIDNRLHCYKNNNFDKKCILNKYTYLPLQFLYYAFKDNKYDEFSSYTNSYKSINYLYNKKIEFLELNSSVFQNITLISPILDNKCKCSYRTVLFKYGENLTDYNYNEINKYKKENIILNQTYAILYSDNKRVPEVVALKKLFKDNNILEVKSNYQVNILYKKYFSSIFSDYNYMI